MKVVILAAGKGSRLGEADVPKPLTLLNNGKSILELQIDHLARHVPMDDIVIVVGYRKEMIMEQFPGCLFVNNPNFSQQNTSKSLLLALNQLNDDVLWINGDVVFHPSIIKDVLDFNRNCMVVNVGPVGEEEVKYSIDAQGKILEVSKQVSHPAGEALGINFFKAEALENLRKGLKDCREQDYFEKGVESCLKQGVTVWSLPIANHLCTEVDFIEDLNRANALLKSWNYPSS